MENPDVFESVFKRAIRQPYEYRDIHLKTILLVTDLDPDKTATYETKVKRFLGGLLPSKESQWITLHKHNYIDWVHLRTHVERHCPSLIVTSASRFPQSPRRGFGASFWLGSWNAASAAAALS